MKTVSVGAWFFFFASVCLPIARSAFASTEKTPPPDQVIGDFTLDSYVQGDRQWTLDAPKAYVYEPEKRVEVDKPHVRFFNRGRPGSVLDAGKGLLHTDRRDMTAWGGVVMVSTEGTRVESPSMDYRAAEDRVVSTAPVTVLRGASILRGVGWEAKPDLSRLVVHHQTVEYEEPDR